MRKPRNEPVNVTTEFTEKELEQVKKMVKYFHDSIKKQAFAKHKVKIKQCPYHYDQWYA